MKQFKDTVLIQHKEWKVKVDAEKSLKHFKRSHEGHEENKEENKDTYCQEVFKTVSLESVTENLPDEILHEIFSYITDPRDFGRASMVCRRWNSISKTLQFWKNLPLSQWERGIWTFRNVELYDILLADKSGDGDYSEPAVYDAILELLPEVGNGTRTLSVSGSKFLTNTQMKKILKVIHI